jgi:uncharacterized glyoxalase superfamily protein PhnB
MRNPPPGFQTVSPYLLYVNDVDALHERARCSGGEVTDLETSPVGDRHFTATDPEGQVWVFAQRVADPAS